LADEIRRIDLSEIERYNLRARAEYRLHVELGPCPYEGDIASAPIVLLLANPGFDKTSTLQDHTFEHNGWPFAGLHPDAPKGVRDWLEKRLLGLIKEFGAQHVSQSIAALQITPWASKKFDSDLRLPSREQMLKLAEDATARGALIIVMRAEKLWDQDERVAHGRWLKTKNPRCSYVSMGNLGEDGWRSVLKTMRSNPKRLVP